MMETWRKLGPGARGSLIGAAAALLVATAGAAYWLLRPDYQVLFGDLGPQDAAAMTAELDRLKVPYELREHASAEGGTAILVDRQDVHRTRLKLMGKDLPLHGTVGLELFNNSDFGVTEFAQRVNYQRALQGELTRTILAMAEIRDARVLLALPEQGLFKQARAKATASITLTLRQGRALAPAQVAGMQRLVAAAVPGIAAPDVTIADQSGVALTRAAGEAEGEASSARLELKRELEGYLARKAGEVLDRTLGAGQALASVDVTLDLDRVQTTTENVLAPASAPGHVQTGVVVRERETLREMNAPLRTAATAESGESTGGSSQREVEYAVGRRVEQVVAQPGSIRRLHVVAVVRKGLDAGRLDALQRLVAASVGASAERGDVVVVQAMEALAPAAVTAGSQRAAVGSPAGGDEERGPRRTSAGPRPASPALETIGLTVGGAALAIAAWLASARWRRRGDAPGRTMTESERRAALAQVEAWLHGEARGETPRAGGAR